MAIDHQKLDEGLRQFLADSSGYSVGLMEAERTLIDEGPDSEAADIYAYIEPLTPVVYPSSFGSVWNQAEVPYAFYSYGPDMNSASIMAKALRDVFLDWREYAMNLTGFDIMDRQPNSGPSRPEEVGVNLFSVREEFRLVICAQSV